MSAAAHRPRVLFVSNVAWDYLWQRHQTLATLFARDHEVVYCEVPGLRKLRWSDLGRVLSRLTQLLGRSARRTINERPAGLQIVRPFILPSTNAFFHLANRWLLSRVLQRHPAFADAFKTVITYSAARAALHIVDQVNHGSLVYDCTDNFSAIRGIPKSFAGNERELLRRADLTLVPGETLARQHQAIARKLAVVPHGAMVERFSLPQKAPSEPCGFPTLVYYGHIHTQHLDCKLIEEIAQRQPDWRILLVGPMVTAWTFPTNVELAGNQAHENLREFLARADVIILPYARNEYTETVFPAKTFECLATGLPIVATPLPELKDRVASFVAFATGPDDFIATIIHALTNDSTDARAKRIDFAKSNGWDRRFEEVQALLASLPSGSPR